MADYVGMCRSNYFVVNDIVMFREFCQRFRLRLIDHGAYEGDGVSRKRQSKRRRTPFTVGFYCEEGGIPSSIDGDHDDVIEVDFLRELAAQLAEGQVAIVHEIGYENMRYLIGVASAVDWRGRIKSFGLDDIMKQAQRMAGKGVKVTKAEY